MEAEINSKNQITTNPLVSIVVITYNSSKYVLETLESAKAQTYQNIELIVSDDCSTDNTVNICKEWLADHHERFIRTSLVTSAKNTGISSNCNRGIAEAKGEWIKFIAGDDMLLEHCVQSNIEFTRINPNAKIVHSNSNFYNNDFNIDSFIRSNNWSPYVTYDQDSVAHLLKGDTKSNRKIILKNDNIKGSLTKIFTSDKIEANEQYRILLRYNSVSAPTEFFHKSLLYDFNGFDESIPFIEDLPMWLKITKSGIKMYFLNSTTANYRVHENSITHEISGKTIFNNFYLKQRYVFVRYIFPDLPVWEIFFNNLEYYRLLILSKLGMNKSNQINRIIYRLTYIPSFIFEKWVFNNLFKAINNQLKIRDL